MANKRGQIRPSEETMKAFTVLISKIHVNTSIKLTHDEYIKQSMVLMEQKYKKMFHIEINKEQYNIPRGTTNK